MAGLPTAPSSQAYAATKSGTIDQKRLDSFGFPKAMVEAFLRTADATNCVVMSRAPGGATTELIRAGHDLKGYLVKAKSCDWGPMAGFLCQLPAFNKKGSKKLVYNYKNHKKYLEYRVKHHITETEPYVPLRITTKRKDEILASVESDKEETRFLESGFHQKLANGNIAGLAFSHDKSVVAEYLLVKQKKTKTTPELWALYHGNIFYKPEGSDSYLDLLDKTAKADLDGKVDRRKAPCLEPPLYKSVGSMSVLDLLEWQDLDKLGKTYKKIDAVDADYETWLERDGIGITSRPQREHFYPICGVQNPYPPYTDTEAYKNAVTGDYDLFAVWPVRPPIGFDLLVRLSELELPWSTRVEGWETKQPSVPFFCRKAGKPLALELRASPGVLIEMIPGFDEIGKFESEELGNISDATALVVGHLNDLASIAMEGAGGGAGRFSPNRAFHSDEGGRPGIDEIDYPFAVFLPGKLFQEINKDIKSMTGRSGSGKSLTRKTAKQVRPPGRVLIIDKGQHDEFLGLACMLRQKCYVTFNHVWLMQMFALLAGKEKLASPKIDIRDADGEDAAEIKEERNKFFEERKKELATFARVANERMRKRIVELFIGATLKTENTAEISKSIDNLAGAFLEIAALDMGGKGDTVQGSIDRLRATRITLPSG